jgi:hypothetical protein
MSQKIRREVVLEFEPEDLLQFFREPESIWYIRARKNIPEDARVLRVQYDPCRHILQFVMASETHGFGFQVGKYCVPPNLELGWEAKGMRIDGDQ